MGNMFVFLSGVSACILSHSLAFPFPLFLVVTVVLVVTAIVVTVVTVTVIFVFTVLTKFSLRFASSLVSRCSRRVVCCVLRLRSPSVWA
jgi:hypothetical protein